MSNSNFDLVSTEKIELPQYVDTIISAFYSAGYECFAVGGYIRDTLLGRQSHDCDLCTNAKPDEIKSILSAALSDNYKIQFVDTGIKYGTVTLLIDDCSYEITTYRVDEHYSDHRKPDTVTYTQSLITDLSRRDFTMNAIAYNNIVGFVDPFNGINDIIIEMIRCVGEPENRFTEDALRILRAMRFSGQLNFNIALRTQLGMEKCKEFLATLSKERVASELTKLLASEHGSKVIKDYHKMLFIVLPQLKLCYDFEQHNPHHMYDVFEHCTATVTYAKYFIDYLRSTDCSLLDDTGSMDLCLYWAALLHDVGKPDCFSLDETGIGHFYHHAKRSVELADYMLTTLKLLNKDRDTILTLIKYHDIVFEANKKFCRKWMLRLGTQLFVYLCALRIADVEAQRYNENDDRVKITKQCLKLVEDIIAEESLMTANKLCITGKTLITWGYKPGPIFSTILNDCVDSINDEKLNKYYEDVKSYVLNKYNVEEYK